MGGLLEVLVEIRRFWGGSLRPEGPHQLLGGLPEVLGGEGFPKILGDPTNF